MTSRFTRLSVLGFAGVLIASLLSASASQAYSVRGIYPSSPIIAVYNNTGADYAKTYVYVKCIAKSTCSGSAAYQTAGLAPMGHALWSSYSVPAGTGRYIIVKINKDQFNRVGTAYDGKVPNRDTVPAIGAAPGETAQISGRLLFREARPYKQELPNNVKLEQREERRAVTGSIDGPGASTLKASNELKVTLWKVKGLQSQRVAVRSGSELTQESSSKLTFEFGSAGLNYNNAPAVTEYRVSVSAKIDGERREWFWRGPSAGGTTTGGSTDLRGSSPVRISKSPKPYDPVAFDIPVRFGTITGGQSGAGSVAYTLAGAPAVMPSDLPGRRDLDVPYCAEVFGHLTTSGDYTFPFVPRGPDNAYLVRANPTTGMTVWNNTWGSCLHARNYRYARDAGAATDLSRANLITFGGATTKTGPSINVRPVTSGFTGDIDYNFSPGYYDRYVYVREYIPGVPILNSPIINSVAANSSGGYTLSGLPQGKYWLDIGRPVGVSDWFKSRYSNNASHFTSESDRETEIWKSFSRLSNLPGSSTSGLEAIAVKHGASYAAGKQNSSPGSGYAGWMYRDYTPTKYGQGYYTAITIPEGGLTAANPNVNKGATITGHISRQGGRTNKEMMVSAYSIDNVRVMRSAVSDGSGNFRITGLAPGKYNIQVNTDSWRGLGRTFTGAHTKSVSGSGFYSVGTLYAKF